MPLEKNSPMRVAFFGEAMAELSLDSDENLAPSMGFGGDTMNTAIYLKRLMGEHAQVSYLTVLGHDPLSQRLISMLQRESIDTSTIARHADRPVGLYAITTDEQGERTFSYWRSASAARTLFQCDNGLNFDSLKGFDVLYFSAISLAILPADVRVALLNYIEQLRKDNQVISIFDSNYRPTLWESTAVAQQSVAAAWRQTDIALPSIDDEQNLFKDADEAALLSRLRGYGIEQGALKRGAAGPLSLAKADESGQAQAVEWSREPVSVVDTTAAGDSFNAGYISAVLKAAVSNNVSVDDGQGVAIPSLVQMDALRAGHACASRVIAHRGAIIPLEQW